MFRVMIGKKTFCTNDGNNVCSRSKSVYIFPLQDLKSCSNLFFFLMRVNITQKLQINLVKYKFMANQAFIINNYCSALKMHCSCMLMHCAAFHFWVWYLGRVHFTLYFDLKKIHNLSNSVRRTNYCSISVLLRNNSAIQLKIPLVFC